MHPRLAAEHFQMSHKGEREEEQVGLSTQKERREGERVPREERGGDLIEACARNWKIMEKGPELSAWRACQWPVATYYIYVHTHSVEAEYEVIKDHL